MSKPQSNRPGKPSTAGLRCPFGLRLSLQKVGILALLALMGCDTQPAIRQYTVPREPSTASSGAASAPREILAAIVPENKEAWFFKLIGDPAKIALYKDDFRRLVSSLSFSDDGKPQWQLPESWREETGGPFTYASLRPPGEDSLKITVSPLAMPGEPSELDEAAWQEYVVRNVNRWRDQLQLSGKSWEEISPALEPIENLSKAKAPAYFVTLRGTGEGGGSAGMASTPPTVPPSRSTKQDVQFDLPEGWREVPPLSVIALKSFEVAGSDGTKATVTLTSAGGDAASNVARWNSQIGGPAEQASKALEDSEKVTVNGVSSEVVFLTGPGKDSQAIMAAMVPWNSQSTLFVKLMGPAPLVESQRESFTAFLKSLTW